MPRRQQVADQLELSAIFQENPSSTVHSAAGWLLRTWRLATPPLEPREPSEAGPSWVVKQIGTQEARGELTFIRSPRGEFIRRDDDEPGSRDQRVELTREFWLSDREVSVGLFRPFVEAVGEPGSEYRRKCPAAEFPEDWKWAGEDKDVRPTDRHPVRQVDWNDAVRFCNWLSRRENRSPCYVASPGGWTLTPGTHGYRLPTEAEWEYACRAGTKTAYSSGSDDAALKRYAVFDARSSVEGATRMPNPWGLFDMHGNVWEWCQDWSDKYASKEHVVDPPGATEGVLRVIRGGSWFLSAVSCRSSYRYRDEPAYRNGGLGFRVARSSSGKESGSGPVLPPEAVGTGGR
jgi:formylglycine-generating enzyme required for sulfatase activity